MCVLVFATESNAKEELPALAELFKSNRNAEEFNGFSDLNSYKEFSLIVNIFLML